MKNHFRKYYTFPNSGMQTPSETIFNQTYLDLLHFIVCLTFIYHGKDIKSDV